MKQAYTDDQVLPYPKSRRFLEAAMRSTHDKPMIHGLLEVDVTDARASLRDYQARTGEPLSFTAFIIVCLAKAVDENKAVHALRWGSSRVILFADVDVLTWVERDVSGQQTHPAVHFPIRESQDLRPDSSRDQDRAGAGLV